MPPVSSPPTFRENIITAIHFFETQVQFLPAFIVSIVRRYCILIKFLISNAILRWLMFSHAKERIKAIDPFFLSACETHDLWRWNRQSVPKRRNMKFRIRGITQKKECNTHNTENVWKQEQDKCYISRVGWQKT
jgi:hypothetical protein